MTRETGYQEERLGRLLSLLRPAPEGWVRAATELPEARRSLDEIITRAEQDLEFRRALVSDLESALAREGYEPVRPLVDELRKRFRNA
jgi:hypothetical protein